MLRCMEVYVALLVIAVLICSPVQAIRAEVQPPGSTSTPPGRDTVRLLSSTSSGVSFRLDVPWQSLSVEPVSLAEQRYTRISIPGWSTAGDTGSPALPALARPIGAPLRAELSVRVEPGPAHTLTLPAPALPIEAATIEGREPATAGIPPLPAASYTPRPDPAVYSNNNAYPGILAKVAADGLVRQQRVVGIVAYPVQYRPATRELTVYEWLKLDITFENAFLSETDAKQARPESPAYEEIFRSQLLNYEAARQWRQFPTYERDRAASSLPSFQEEHEKASTSGVTSEWTPPIPAWRVKVRADGIYRLDHDDLLHAGLPVDTLDPSTLQVYYRGSEAAIYVGGETDGRLDPGDYVLFYGQALASKYTLDNVYWLTYGQGPGLRMRARSGAPGEGTKRSHYRAFHRLEANLIYRSRNPGDEALERWLWDYVYPPSKSSWSHTFTLVAPYTGPDTARLTIAMLGALDDASNPDHHTKVYVNGTEVEDAKWDGLVWRVAELEFPQSYLRAGDNTISVVCPNDTGAGVDLVYIDWAELEYANTLRVEGDALAFGDETTGTWQYQVDGFTSADVAVYDVTNPAGVERIEDIALIPSGSTYSAIFQDSLGSPANYWAGTSSAYRSVQATGLDAASDLRSASNGADYIVLTHEAFATQAATLTGFRAQQGLRAKVVDVQDVYDEFGYGVVSAPAIHDFLAYAYGNWEAPAPSYVVLLGDGHYDPKNHLEYAPIDYRVSYVPPYLAPVDPWINETAADNRYVTLSGEDAFPDMMLGRLSVNSSAEATVLVNKIIDYENSPAPGDWQQQLLAAADDADSAGDFAKISDNLLADHLPSPFQATKIYYGTTHQDVGSARSALQAEISAGKLIVNYVGHAAVTAWASEGLFKTGDVPLLRNGSKLPVMLAMTCYDGYFLYPYRYSDGTEATAEVITRAGERGAVASWSPTGLGVATGHDFLDSGFLEAVFEEGERTLGAATTAGKLDLWATGSNLDLIDTYLLFGDPATQLAITPGAAPVAPDIAVQRVPGTSNAELTWLNRMEDPYYEVWRGTTPYFDPAQGQGNQIVQLWGEPYGSMGEVSYTDDGADRHFSDPSDPQLAPVEVIGDTRTSYFWVVRGRDGGAVSGNSNRVGEFDYSLRHP